MKKLLVVLLTAAMALTIVACSADKKKDENQNTEAQKTEITQGEVENDEDIASFVNPVIEKTSLDEVNEEVGCKLAHPPVMGATDEYFAVIGAGEKIGEYRITINGIRYICRASKTQENITGVYLDDGMLGDEVEGGFVGEGEYSLAKWFDGDMQYVIYTDSSDEAVINSLSAFADEMKILQSVQ